MTGNLGGEVLSLPAFPTSSGANGPGAVVGGSLGIDGVVHLGPVDGFDPQLGLSVFGIVGTGLSSSTQTFSGPGVLVVPGYTTPPGTITLTTSAGGGTATVASDVSALGNSTTVPSTPFTANSDASGVQPGTTPAGFLYGGYFASGPSDLAGAFGAIGSTEGGIFIASGDLDGLTVTTSTHRNVLYSGADLSLGLGNGGTSDTTFSGFAGPSVRLLGQNVVTDVSVDIPERSSGPAFPIYTDERTEDLNSIYYGAIVGFDMTHAVSTDTALNVGAKFGLYAVNTNFKGGETYSIDGSNPQSATLAGGPSASNNGTAYSVDLTASLTKSVSKTLDLGFNGGVNFLSSVATLTRSGSTPAPTSSTYAGTDSGTATYDGTTPQSDVPGLAFGSMVGWHAGVSLTGHF